jgi:protein-tyrosine phosphatase
MIDLHCHLLPGLDDGAGNFNDALDMATGLRDMGFTSIACTPHLPWKSLRVSADALGKARLDLFSRLCKYNVHVDLFSGAEHFVTHVPDLLSSDGLILYPRGDTLLIEFGLPGFPPRLDDLLFRLQVRQLTPVVAHVERYPEVQQDVRVLDGLKKRGCKLLVNLTSLGGGWDGRAKNTAREAIRADLIDAVSTDLHGPAELKYVTAGLNELFILMGSEGMEALTVTNPADIAGLPPLASGGQS